MIRKNLRKKEVLRRATDKKCQDSASSMFAQDTDFEHSHPPAAKSEPRAELIDQHYAIRGLKSDGLVGRSASLAAPNDNWKKAEIAEVGHRANDGQVCSHRGQQRPRSCCAIERTAASEAALCSIDDDRVSVKGRF